MAWYELAEPSELRECQQRIAERFADDCRMRARLAHLPVGMLASGQYFDQPDRGQRGLHGTAAALRVFAGEASRDAEFDRMASEVIRYLKEREVVELGVAETVMQSRRPGTVQRVDEVALWTDKFRHDKLNTVKQAELLYALAVAYTGGVAENCAQLRRAVTRRLMSGRANDEHGWATTLDPAKRSNDVATAYVIRALHANGYDVERWASGLGDRMRQRLASGNGDVRDARFDCLILHTLVVTESIERRVARRLADAVWSKVAADFTSTGQAREPLFDGPKANYVLVPWQLHLIAVFSMVRWRRYLLPAAQRTLTRTVDVIAARGSLDPDHDGEHVATRSYFYAYDALETCLGSGPSKPGELRLARVLGATEGLRRGIGQLVAWLIGLAGAGLAVYATIAWIRNGASWSDLAPNFVSSLVLMAFGFGMNHAIRR